MKVYDPTTKKVLLAKLTASSQMIADNAGKQTSRVHDFWRTKTYVKPHEMVYPEYPRFPQPYAVAQARLGGTYNDYNEVFIIQVAACSLNSCWYCYLDKTLLQGRETSGDGIEVARWFTIGEILEMWKSSGCRILRISGGEPTLASEFIFELIKAGLPDRRTTRAGGKDFSPYFWIDTNMATGDLFFDACDSFREGKMPCWRTWEQIGMCGCFKGFTNEEAEYHTGISGLLDKQLEFARRLVDYTPIDPYFYIPDAVLPTTTLTDIRTFFDRLREQVDENAPLRTYILHVKQYASTDKNKWNECVDHIRFPIVFPESCPESIAHDLDELAVRPINLWKALCEEVYPPELLWLPSHQVPLTTLTTVP